jgi:hypothetical protein
MEQVSNPNEREALAGSLKLGVNDSVGQKRGLFQRNGVMPAIWLAVILHPQLIRGIIGGSGEGFHHAGF